MKKIPIALLTVVALLLPGLLRADDAIISNGDFEEKGPADSFIANQVPPGWSISAPTAYWVGGSTVFRAGAESGNCFVAVQSADNKQAGFYTTMKNLTAGTTYRVTFYVHGGSQFGYDPATTWYVVVGHTDGLNDQTIGSGSHTSNSSWEKKSVTFVADVANEDLFFNVSATTSGAGTYFDNVSVTPDAP